MWTHFNIYFQVQTSSRGRDQEHPRDAQRQGQPERSSVPDRGRGLAHQRAAQGAREQVGWLWFRPFKFIKALGKIKASLEFLLFFNWVY